MIPNGHVQFPCQNAIPSSGKRSQKSSRNAPEVIALENKNWLIHYHYCRREFGICSILIKEELSKSNGTNEFVNYVQGIILRHEGRIQESLEYFQRCHMLNPRGVDNIKQVARSLFLLGRQKLSVDAFLEAKNTARAPEWDVYHNLGVCSIALGDIAKAKEYLRQAVQLNRQEKSFEALANIHLMQDDVQGAIDIYKAALDVSPDSADLATSLGLVYMRIGEHQKAFEKFGSALAHDPKCPRALLAVGAMMQDHKEHDVALSKYKIASLYYPESPALWNNIGMCFFGKKKFIAAITCLKRANYLAPFEWKILYNLGLIHLISQQYASAFHFLSSAVSLNGKNGAVYLALAVTLVNLRDVRNARYAFEQAVALSPDDPVAHLNYSMFMFKQGDIVGAEKELKIFHEVSQKCGAVDYDVLEIASNLKRGLKMKGIEESVAAEEAEDEAKKSPEQELAAEESDSDEDGTSGSESHGVDDEQVGTERKRLERRQSHIMAPDEV